MKGRKKMIQRIEYEVTPYLFVEQISVVGDFNNYDAKKGKMKRDGSKWFINVYLEQGDHFYKFLINDVLQLNDPLANMYLPDQQEELWSVIRINEMDERLYNNSQYTVNIEKYCISNYISQEQIDVNKKIFNPMMDEKTVARFEFTNVTGIHTVTALWCGENGIIHEVGNNVLYTPEESPEEPIILWYWMNLEDKSSEEFQGIWSIKLFIDGTFILEDQFQVEKMMTYSKAGKMKSF